MTTNDLPSKAQLLRELNELCGKIGYRIGSTQEALERIPGLVGLTIVGGLPPTSPVGWQERRDAIRNVLREITENEVKNQLGEPYPYAATKVFRLDEQRPLEPAAHRRLNEIQASLDEKFGGEYGGKAFFNNHRELLFDVIVKSLQTRERQARQKAKGHAEADDPASPQEDKSARKSSKTKSKAPRKQKAEPTRRKPAKSTKRQPQAKGKSKSGPTKKTTDDKPVGRKRRQISPRRAAAELKAREASSNDPAPPKRNWTGLPDGPLHEVVQTIVLFFIVLIILQVTGILPPE